MFIVYLVILALAVYIAKFRADFDAKSISASAATLLIIFIIAGIISWVLS